jgi:hypothetical protein
VEVDKEVVALDLDVALVTADAGVVELVLDLGADIGLAPVADGFLEAEECVVTPDILEENGVEVNKVLPCHILG